MRRSTNAKAGILTFLCAAAAVAGPQWTAIDCPTSVGAIAPRLTSSGGELLLSWIEPGENATPRLLVARLDRGELTAPELVHQSATLLANAADVPGVAVLPSTGERIAWWPERFDVDSQAYGVRLARSAGAGRPWVATGWLHDDRSAVEHGFVSVVGAAARAFWLDGRSMGEDGNTALYARRVDRADAREHVLDHRVCECCSTDAAFGHEGPLVVYRDRSADEVRDVAVVRETAAGFSAPTVVHRDGWTIDGCPVNGPAIDATPDGPAVAVAWFTAAEDRPRVQVAFSADSARSFDAPIVLDSSAPIGRVDLALSSANEAWVAWLARDGGGEIHVAKVRAGATGSQVEVVGAASEARASGVPSLARHGGSLWLAWIEQSPDGDRHLRVSRRNEAG